MAGISAGTRRVRHAVVPACAIAAATAAAPAALGAVSATFQNGTLTVTGDSGPNAFEVHCGSAAFVGEGSGGPPTEIPNDPAPSCGAVTSVVIDGAGGDDSIIVNSTGFTAATVTAHGGAGDD